MNKDNFVDLVVEGQLATSCPGPCPVGFAVYRGNGNGAFTLTTSVPTNTTLGTQLFIADLDGDGYPDILTLNNGSQVTNSIDIYRNSGGTSFGTLSGGVYVPSASVSLVNYPATYTGVFTGDFNGDGLPDLGVIYTSGNGVTTALNTSTAGNISFASPSTFATPTAGVSASAGDFTSDGNIDILVATSTTMQVYDGNGKGGFFTNYGSLTATPGGTIASALASDLNGDGDADVVLISSTVGAAGLCEQHPRLHHQRNSKRLANDYLRYLRYCISGSSVARQRQLQQFIGDAFAAGQRRTHDNFGGHLRHAHGIWTVRHLHGDRLGRCGRRTHRHSELLRWRDQHWQQYSHRRRSELHHHYTHCEHTHHLRRLRRQRRLRYQHVGQRLAGGDASAAYGFMDTVALHHYVWHRALGCAAQRHRFQQIRRKRCRYVYLYACLRRGSGRRHSDPQRHFIAYRYRRL